MPIDESKLPVAPEEEGTGHKAWRLLTHPITESLGLNPAIDKALAPSGANVKMEGKTATVEDPSFWDKAKGFLAGATEAVTPGHVAAALAMAPEAEALMGGGAGLTNASSTLGLGGASAAPTISSVVSSPVVQGASLVGNAGMAAQGAGDTYKDIKDPNASKGKVALDVLNTGLGIFGGRSAYKNIRGAAQGINAAAEATKAATTPDILKTQYESLLNDIANKDPRTIEQLLKEKYPELDQDTIKKTGGIYAKKIWGEGTPQKPGGRPTGLTPAEQHAQNALDAKAAAKAEDQAFKLNQNEAASDVQVNESGIKDQDTARKKLDTDLYNATKADAANTKPLAKAEESLAKAQGAAMDQNAKLDARTERQQGAAIDQNLKVDKTRKVAAFKQGDVIRKARAAADAEDAARTGAAIEEANSLAQQGKIDALKAERGATGVVNEGPVTETSKGVGPNGEAQKQTKIYADAPPDEEGGSGGGDEGDKTPPTKTFFQKAKAFAHADKHGGAEVMDVRKNEDGSWTAGPKEAFEDLNANDKFTPAPELNEQPIEKPKAPKGGAASKALMRGRPFAQLRTDEQDALTPFLRDALDNGYKGDIEDLADELAGRYGATKEGLSESDLAGSNSDALLAAVRKNGGIKSTKETAGDVKLLKSQFQRPTSGLFNNKAGKTLDDMATSLGRESGWEHVGDPNKLINALRDAGVNEPRGKAIDNLKLNGDWWHRFQPEGAPLPKPAAEVTDFSDPVNQANMPETVEVPPPTQSNKAAKLAEVADLSGDEGLANRVSGRKAGMGTMPAEAPTEPVVKRPNSRPRKPRVEVEPNLPEVTGPGGGAAKPLDPNFEPPLNLTSQQIAPQEPSLDFNAPPSPTEGPSPLRFFKEPVVARGRHYEALRDFKDAGEDVPKDVLAQAGQRARIAGQDTAKAVAEGTKAPEEFINDLSPKGQDSFWQAVKKNIKVGPAANKGGPKGFTTSMAGAGQGEDVSSALRNNKLFAARLATGALGGATGYEDDPLGNPLLSAAAGAGVGYYAPGLLAKGITRGSSVLASAAKPVDTGLNILNNMHNVALLSPNSVVKKAAGDIGGMGLAALENPKIAGNLMKMFTTPEGRATLAQAFKEGYVGPETEAATGLDNFNFQNWQPNNIAGKAVKGALTASGKTMGGLTHMTKTALGEAGLTPQQQRYYTLTDYPSTVAGKKLYEAVRGNPAAVGEEAQRGSKLLQHLVPFARIGINRVERGIEYSPLGLIKNPRFYSDPEKAQEILNKAILGSLVTGGAYGLTPDNFVKDHPLAASSISALGGPLGLPMMVGMAAKQIHERNPDEPLSNAVDDASKAIAQDIPGLRLIEDLSAKSKTSFARNYFSGYTNVTRPLALLLDKARGITDEPDVSSNTLPLSGKLFNRMLSNIPVVRDTLPKKGESSGVSEDVFRSLK